MTLLSSLRRTLSLRAAASAGLRTRESVRAGARLAREASQAARCDALATDTDAERAWFLPRASVAATGAEAPAWARMDARFLRSAGGAL